MQEQEDPHTRMRRDDRSPEEFERTLAISHRKERLYIDLFLVDLAAWGCRGCHCEDHGVDNTGRVIRGRLKNANADFLVHGMLPAPTPTEVKANIENPKYMTFKRINLEAYQRKKAMILVPTTKEWHLLGQTAIKAIMQTCRVRTDHSGTGDKAAYRAGQGTDPDALRAAARARLREQEIGLVDRLVQQGHIMTRPWTTAALQRIGEIRHLLLERARDED
jgi:hypothetical protein